MKIIYKIIRNENEMLSVYEFKAKETKICIYLYPNQKNSELLNGVCGHSKKDPDLHLTREAAVLDINHRLDKKIIGLKEELATTVANRDILTEG